MASPFAITTATSTIVLDSGRQGEITFTVSNTTERGVRGRANLVGSSAAVGSWMSLSGEAECDYERAGSQQYTVKISVPQDALAGSYTLRLDVVDLANPDDDFSEGPTVNFVVPEPVPVKKPFPWWIVAVVVGVLILIGGAVYGLSQVSRPKPVVVATPTATMAPTPTTIPKPLFGPGRWRVSFQANDGVSGFGAFLQINTPKNGVFEGSLSQPLDEGTALDHTSGREGTDLKLFPVDAQLRLRDAILHYGDGNGLLVYFTNDSRQLSIKGPGSGCVATLNCSFAGVVFKDGSLHGIWFNPGSTQFDGTFVVNKAEEVTNATAYLPLLATVPVATHSNNRRRAGIPNRVEPPQGTALRDPSDLLESVCLVPLRCWPSHERHAPYAEIPDHSLWESISPDEEMADYHARRVGSYYLAEVVVPWKNRRAVPGPGYLPRSLYLGKASEVL